MPLSLYAVGCSGVLQKAKQNDLFGKRLACERAAIGGFATQREQTNVLAFKIVVPNDLLEPIAGRWR
jgi:hypothetical protein